MAAVMNEAAATVSVIAGSSCAVGVQSSLSRAGPGPSGKTVIRMQSPHDRRRGLNTTEDEAEAREMFGIPVEHPRGFGNSNLADPHQHNEERAHQDLRSSDVADGGEAGDRTQHEGTHLRCATAADVLDEVSNRQIVVRAKPGHSA